MSKRKAVIQMLIVPALLSVCLADGFRTHIGPEKVPLVIVRGDAREMGRCMGVLMQQDARQLIGAMTQQLGAAGPRYSKQNLDAAWHAVSPHISEQWKEQLRGLAEGSGIDHRELIRAHMIPVVGDYSCSGAVIWGEATADGRMYAFRNLDYALDMHMQDLPAVVVCIPADGLPHVNPTFAGFIGVQTGMNQKGLVLTEMGDSPGRDYPFDLDGVPFFTLFSDMLYRADTMEAALAMIRRAQRIKKYHYVIGCAADSKGVKIRAHAPELDIWTDNDPDDEVAPNVYQNIVINPESRAPIAFEHIKANYGGYTLDEVIDLTKAIPIKGGNLFAVVYNVTDLKMYFAYARGMEEAYKRPFQRLDLKKCFDYNTALQSFPVEQHTSDAP